MVGSDLEMPFICPADIFLNPNVLSTENPSFPHRAANFLSSEKVGILCLPYLEFIAFFDYDFGPFVVSVS